MKKFIINAQFLSLVVLGFLTLCILGAEPSEASEAGLERYEASAAYWAPIILWSWLAVFIVFISLTAVRFYKNISE